MDVMVTVAKDVWLNWLAEGDLAGDDPGSVGATGEEWALFYGQRPGPRKVAPPSNLRPGDRVYVVAFGFVRGFSVLTRIQDTRTGFALVRGGAATACTPWGKDGPVPVPGFRGVHYVTWDRASEGRFPDWMTHGMPASVQAHVEQLRWFRKDKWNRATISQRAIAGERDPRRLLAGLPRPVEEQSVR